MVEEFIIPTGRKEKDIVIPTHDDLGRLVSICLLEIGCKEEGKRGQVRDKQKLVRKGIVDYIENHLGGDDRKAARKEGKVFSIYRGVVHYQPEPISYEEFKKNWVRNRLIEFMFHYVKLTPQAVAMLDNTVKDELVGVVKNKGQKPKARAMLDNNDGEELYKYICDLEGYHISTDFRGELAEKLLVAHLRSELHPGITLVPNPNLNIRSSRYPHGTEVDVLAFFYDDSLFYESLKRMHRSFREAIQLYTNGHFSRET